VNLLPRAIQSDIVGIEDDRPELMILEGRCSSWCEGSPYLFARTQTPGTIKIALSVESAKKARAVPFDSFMIFLCF
jgi:hypothetical protein